MQISIYFVIASLSVFMTMISIIFSMHFSFLISRLDFTRVCNIITMNRYLFKNTLDSVLENQFCLNAIQQQCLSDDIQSVTWIYNKDNSEKVAIMMNWKNKSDYKLNIDNCLHFLRNIVLDDCDESDWENSKYENLMNWKSDEWLRVDNVISQIISLVMRSQAFKKTRDDCFVRHFEHYDHVLI